MKKKTYRTKKRQKLFLPLILILIVAALIVVFSRRSFSPAVPNISEIGSSSGVVTLALSPPTSSVAPNATQTLTLEASVGTSHLTAVQAVITYSSTCGTPTVTKGSFLTNVLQEAAVANGRLSFTYAAPSSSGGVTGSGPVATISVTPATAGTCTLAFAESTGATVIELDTNALKTVSNATITVGDGNTGNNDQTNEEENNNDTNNENNDESDNNEDTSAQASPSTAAPSITPSRVTSLRSSSVTCNSLSFSWDKIDGAKGYILELADNSDFNNQKSSGTLGSDRDNYSFPNLSSSTQYYARLAQTDVHDFPRYTKLGPVTTLGFCAGAVAPTTPTTKPSPKTTLKASPQASPSLTPSASPTSTLESSEYTDRRFDNIPLEEGATDNTKKSFFASFISWLVSLFQ